MYQEEALSSLINYLQILKEVYMSTISNYLTLEHRSCDELLAKSEDAVHKNHPDAQALTQAFVDDLFSHLDKEERVMFPAFEQATGMSDGPTNMMRQEHMQMRSLASSLVEAVQNSDNKRYFGLTETLMILIQQHNMKEEQMLYPMTDQHTNADEVIGSMQSVVWL